MDSDLIPASRSFSASLHSAAAKVVLPQLFSNVSPGWSESDVTAAAATRRAEENKPIKNRPGGSRSEETGLYPRARTVNRNLYGLYTLVTPQINRRVTSNS